MERRKGQRRNMGCTWTRKGAQREWDYSVNRFKQRRGNDR
jgi:hypothetical protein